MIYKTYKAKQELIFMKKIKNILITLSFLVITSCSKDETLIQYSLTIDVTPTQGGSVSNSLGKYDSGSTVSLLAKPSPEYVFKNWSGDESGNSNPITIKMNSDKSVVANFEKKKYPLSTLIEGEGTVEEVVKINGKTTEHNSGTLLELIAKPTDGWLFKEWKGDLTGSKNPIQTTINKTTTITAVFEKITSIKISNPINELIITNEYFPEIKGKTDSGLEVLLTNFTIKGDAKVTVEGNKITGAKSGNSNIEIIYKELNVKSQFYVSPIEYINVNDFLSKPASGSSLIVPVVVINYLPTKNGIHINQDTYPIRDYGNKIVENLKLTEVSKWVLSNDLRTKFSIEEGSKYRGTDNTNSKPYVGIKVLKYINLYEVPKIPNPRQTVMSDGEEGWNPDYNKIFELINLKKLVNEEGVKEVWFNSKSLYIPESNMSSPTTGDISNSYKENDLPIYNKTYVVYGNFIHRWYAENLHNRGHQIEAQLAHLNSEVFWKDFVGYPKGSPQPYYKGGRCGSTHYTPNSIGDYDYDNKDLVLSDIGDWKPDNSGVKKMVNIDTWKIKRQLPISLPIITEVNNWSDVTKTSDVGLDPQGGWLIYWFQAIPGYNNNIKYGNYTMANWWDLFYNWDDAIKNTNNLWTN